NRHIEEFADLTFQAKPLLHIAGVEIDDLNAAPGIAVTGLEIVVEVETGKRFLARQRQPHHCRMSVEGQAAQKTGEERVLLQNAGLAIDAAEKTAARVEHPERAVPQARRM